MKRFTEFDFGLTWIMDFFHQDWSDYAASAAAAVQNQLVDELDPNRVLSLRRDAQLLLDKLTSDTIEILWRTGSSAEYFFRSDSCSTVESGSEWLATIIRICDSWLSGRDVPELSGADTEDGYDLTEEVLAEIQVAGYLESKVRSALTDCVRYCTPDLGFRILLKMVALHCRGSVLSSAQYARFEQIGSALHYGQFVVEAVHYQVTSD
ncbi:hypothetical protein G3I19_18065 [Streptomyces sp. SID10853]|uniref:hypothetical protein n=1 Tax=Streptomyces sp. SID10853 TaxID=2706028 RepID=UPI0013BF7180|nr:hypothetical protein [Streptomyces sp. SID10853]NDZ80397.1 hypothetical protein [Streptomyces sp. SID10853]